MSKLLILIICLFNNILIFFIFSALLNKIRVSNKNLEQKIFELIDQKGLLSHITLEQEILEIIEYNRLLEKNLANIYKFIIYESLKDFIPFGLFFLISFSACLDYYTILNFFFLIFDIFF